MHDDTTARKHQAPTEATVRRVPSGMTGRAWERLKRLRETNLHAQTLATANPEHETLCTLTLRSPLFASNHLGGVLYVVFFIFADPNDPNKE